MTLRKMIAAAWSWAAKTGNLRKNPVHGEEEARLVLADKFEAQDNTSQEIELSGQMDAEDMISLGRLLNFLSKLGSWEVLL